MADLGIHFSTVAKAESIGSEIWLAVRTDGRTGDGSATNPIDVSTQSKFDYYMGKSGVLNTQPHIIHLGPGIYFTKGVLLNVNSQLLGSGIDVSIIRLAPNAIENHSWVGVVSVTGSVASGASGQVAQDFTVDGNIANQLQAPNDIWIDGIQVTGTLRRVKTINCGNSLSNSHHESFWMGSNVVNAPGPGYNNLIEDCICIAPDRPMYVTFFGIAGTNITPQGPSSVAARNAIIRNCKVVCSTPNGTFDGHGFTMANPDGGIIEDCYTDGISTPVYQDTWTSRNLIVRNNLFERVGAFGVCLNGPFRGSYISELIVEGNIIQLRPETSSYDNSIGVRLYYPSATNLSIKNNKIMLTPFSDPTGALNSGIQIVGCPLQFNGQIRDNCIDLPRVYTRVTSAGQVDLKTVSVDEENNYDSFGENVLGSRYGRATFTIPSAGWYVLWSRKSTGSNMAGRVEIRSRSAWIGDVTLHHGKAAIVDPDVTGTSRVVMHLKTPGGSPGYVHPAQLSPGSGVALSSTDKDDASTYTCTVDSGAESNSYAATIDCPYANGPAILSQIYADNSTSGGEMACTQIRAFGGRANGLVGTQTLEGYFTGPGIVTVDVDCGNDSAYWENHAILPGTPTAGPNGYEMTSLSFDSRKAAMTAVTLRGKLAGGMCTVRSDSISSTSIVTATHLATSPANAGPLYVISLAKGAVTIKSTNPLDNDTFVLTIQ